MPPPAVQTEFTERQFAEPYPDGIERHYWTLARNRVVLGAVQRALEGETRRLVVDIGCGRGITLDHLRAAGIEVLGCDLGHAKPISTAIAPFLRHGVDAAELPADVRERAGVLLLLDVLEHLPEPASFLDSICTHFPNAPTVVITVPARREIWSNYDEHYGHFHRYDIPTSASLFDAGRFEVIRRGYLFRLLYPPALALKWLGRKRGVSIAPPSGAAVALHRLIAAWFGVETALLPRRWPGTSLMLVLRRK